MLPDQIMQLAIEEAQKAAQREEVPIGAVIVRNGEILSIHGNRTRELNDPTAHAEILCIREACQKIGAQRIPECELYVTLEPCAMCAAAIAFARIKTLYIGALDEKGGGIYHGPKFFNQPTCHHKKISIQHSLLADESQFILKSFFAKKR